MPTEFQGSFNWNFSQGASSAHCDIILLSFCFQDHFSYTRHVLCVESILVQEAAPFNLVVVPIQMSLSLGQYLEHVHQGCLTVGCLYYEGGQGRGARKRFFLPHSHQSLLSNLYFWFIPVDLCIKLCTLLLPFLPQQANLCLTACTP